MDGAFARTVGRARHWAEEQAWRTRSGSRWLLHRDLLVLDRFRASDDGGVFAAVERSEYSQNGEDGILAYLFSLLDVSIGVFIEIGAADGEQNCTRALAERGWSGFWIEGDPALAADARGIDLDGRVHVEQVMVTPSAVVGVLRDVGVPPRPDLLSLDIDSCDFWVMRELLRAFDPTVVAVEINGEHPWPWVLPLRQGTGPRMRGWDRSWSYGASLGAYDALLSSHGYSLVGCDSQGVNAFFVRTSSLVDGMRTGPWRSFYRPPTHRPGTLGHPRLSPVEGARIVVDPSDAGLDHVHFDAVRVVGSDVRCPGERFLLLVDVSNGSGSTLVGGEQHPHRLSYRISGPDGGSWLDDGEPQRSELASSIQPGSTRASGIEVIAPEVPGEYLVVPTLVQEGVRWREPVRTEGIRLSVSG